MNNVYYLTKNGVVDINDIAKFNNLIDSLAVNINDEMDVIQLLIQSGNYELAHSFVARLNSLLERVVHVQRMTPPDTYEFSFDYRNTDDYVPLSELHHALHTQVEYVANGEVRK